MQADNLQITDLLSKTLLQQAMQEIETTKDQYDLACALKNGPANDAFRAKNTLKPATDRKRSIN